MKKPNIDTLYAALRGELASMRALDTATVQAEKSATNLTMSGPSICYTLCELMIARIAFAWGRSIYVS
jgi:hypothetical protein